MTDPRLRDAVRAVVIGSDERVLLVRFDLPHWTGWATPGGGVNPGETDEEAIRRELGEETGLERFDLGPIVWTRTHMFELGRWDGQMERYYLIHTPEFEPVPRLTWAQLNEEFVTDVRWWTLDELEAADTSSRFAPRRLPALVRGLILHGPPAEPVDVGS